MVGAAICRRIRPAALVAIAVEAGVRRSGSSPWPKPPSSF
jgi:hypothetical protein